MFRLQKLGDLCEKKRNIYKFSRAFDCKLKNRSTDFDFKSENAKI